MGRLGVVAFPGGFYAYVGSAMSGFESRIGHHLQRNKSPHWHIDYLLREASIGEVILCESKKGAECILAQTLARDFQYIPGFGSSDCKCNSHLYFGNEKVRMKSGVIRAAKQAGFDYRVFSEGGMEQSDIGI